MKWEDGWVIEDDDLIMPDGSDGFPEDALVVLLAADVVLPLNGGDSGICLMVNCSDTFAWATADCERIPPIGFSDDGDEPFWDLWRRWKRDRTWGPIQWVALRRNLRPMSRVVELMQKNGAWTEEMEALPATP